MNLDDFEKYYVPVLERHADLLTSTSYNLGTKAMVFDDFLGINIVGPYLARDPKDDFPLPQRYRDLFTALAGPHGRAVLKAYRIQKGLEK